MGARTIKVKSLEIDQLKDGRPPGVSAAAGPYLLEACVVAFTKNSHSTGVKLSLDGLSKSSPTAIWDYVLPQNWEKAWGDPDDATENGACGIAFLLCEQLTNFNIIERSYKSTGFDYYLGHDKGDNIFENAARLEVSGILKGPERVNARVNQKLKQITPTDGDLPGFVAVIEFSTPKAVFIEKPI